MIISIRTAYASGDVLLCTLRNMVKSFQSTPHTQAVTVYFYRGFFQALISIHTADASGDLFIYFNLVQIWISIHTAYASGDVVG